MPVKAYHYTGNFSDPEDCPLARAANELFSTRDSIEGVRELYSKKRRFMHKIYTRQEFDRDKKLAEGYEFDDTIVRVVTLL